MLSVLLARDVEEEAERVVAPVAAQVALEGVGAGGVVAHVDGVHRLALERYPAKLAGVRRGELLGARDGQQARHVGGGVLLGVGVQVEGAGPLYLVRLALAPVLGGGGGEGGGAGVAARVAAALVVRAGAVRPAADDVISVSAVALLAQVQHAARRLAPALLGRQLRHLVGVGVQRGEDVRLDPLVGRQRRGVLVRAERARAVRGAGDRAVALAGLHERLDGRVGHQPLQQRVGDGDLVEVVHGARADGGHRPLAEQRPRRGEGGAGRGRAGRPLPAWREPEVLGPGA